MMKFGEKETTIFTKIYIKQPVLWDQKHPEYRVRHKRLHAYKEMIAEFYDATSMKLSEIDVRLKIRSLRSTYCQEIQKIKLRSNAGWTYVPGLKWFHEWHKHLAKDLKQNDDSIEVGNNGNSPDNSTNQEHIWMSQDNELPESLRGSTEPEDEETLLDLKPEPIDIEISNSSFKNRKRKFKDLSKTHMDKTCESFIDPTTIDRDDEFDIYGKYIATQLRKMNTQKALRVQLEIQSIVSTARIEDLNGT